MDPAPELTSLPDVPIRAIVSLLPLQQLITSFPRVHPRLSPIRASVLRSNQRLVLHIGDQKQIEMLKDRWSVRLPFAGHLVDSSGALLYANTYPSDFYRLRLDTLDSDSVDQLSTLMPTITHLEVILTQFPLSALSQLTRLLTLWAPTLRTLSLLIGVYLWEGRVPQEMNCQLPPFRHLLRVLNQTLTALEHLSLGFPGNRFPHPNEGDSSICLSVIGRLCEFNFALGWGSDTKAFILDTIEKFASDKLTHLGLPDYYSDLPLSVLIRHRFASRFTQIPYETYYPFSVDSSLHPTVFCRAFPNLTVFILDFNSVTSERLIACFQAFSNLQHLRFFTLSSFELTLPHLAANFSQMSPLRFLKVITILFCTKDRDIKQGHDRLEGPFWATLFPAVQFLKIHHRGRFCGTCYPGEGEYAEDRETDYALEAPCLSQLLAPLKVLPSLRQIFYQHTRQTDCFAEFTPEGTFVGTCEYVD